MPTTLPATTEKNRAGKPHPNSHDQVNQRESFVDDSGAAGPDQAGPGAGRAWLRAGERGVGEPCETVAAQEPFQLMTGGETAYVGLHRIAGRACVPSGH